MDADRFVSTYSQDGLPTGADAVKQLFATEGAKHFDGELAIPNNLDHERELAFFEFPDGSTIGVARIQGNDRYDFWRSHDDDKD